MNHCKRVVFLKDVRSNLIEEAIFVLRDNDKDKQSNRISCQATANNQSPKSGGNVSDSYLISEAELILKEYLKNQAADEKLPLASSKEKERDVSQFHSSPYRGLKIILYTLFFSTWIVLLYLLCNYLFS